MVVVAVAGGLGDLGRLVVDELLKRTTHDVVVLSRRAPSALPKDALWSSQRQPAIVQVSYAAEEPLAQTLARHNVHTVICTFGIDFQSAADAQVTLIRAADRAAPVRRFLPSEFNVDYDLGDDRLPYPEKNLHAAGRRALEQTASLEYAYVYCGMFMDYYAMPNVETPLKPLYNVVDAAHGAAAIPGDGNTPVALAFTRDVARYVALCVDLPAAAWPRVLRIVTTQVTLNALVRLVETCLGRALDSVVHEPVEALARHDVTVLPGNEPTIDSFPGGREQVKALLADLGAAMALGAYDIASYTGAETATLDVIRHFEGQTEPPLQLEALLEAAWKGKEKGSTT